MTFLEWSVHPSRGARIILDIDGTLLPAGDLGVAPKVAAAVARLKEENEVFLFSNKRLPGRNRVVAAAVGASLIDSRYRKPHPGVLRALPPTTAPFVVVGDKVLTDGLFAFFTGAAFVRVSRLTGPNESLADRLFNAVDTIAADAWAHARLLRMHQWTKNVIVFAPVFFARHFFDPAALQGSAAAFVALCFVASAGYVLNDMYDREADRAHPHKRHRPLASGEVSTGSALVLAALLALGALFASSWAPAIIPVLAAYLGVSLLYSFFLKRVPIVEMLAFIWFYLARVIAGAQAANVPLSAWLTLAIVFLALFLVTAKRFSESRAGRARAALAKYSHEYLQGMLLMSGALVIAFYGLYSVLGVSSPLAVYSTLPVVAGVMRYLQLALQNNDAEYPEKLLFKDKGLLACALAWLLCMAVVFY